MVADQPEGMRLTYLRLSDLDAARIDSRAAVSAGNRRFLVRDVTGLSATAGRLLAMTRPVVAYHDKQEWVILGNFRTLAILRTAVHARDFQVPVIEIVDRSLKLETWRAWDDVVAPLLDAHDPSHLREAVAAAVDALGKSVDQLWPQANTVTGLANILGVSRTTLQRVRKPQTKATE